MTVHVHGFYAGWELLFVVLWFLVLKCAAMDLAPLQQIVNDAIRECLILAELTDKEAASLMQMSETTFRRALSGEPLRSLSLARMFMLPYRFWLRFGPALMWMVAKKHAQEIAETFGQQRKA